MYLVWRGGVPGLGGGYLVRYSPPPVNRMTNRCKNITLAKTSFRPVIIYISNKYIQITENKTHSGVVASDLYCPHPAVKYKTVDSKIIHCQSSL